MARIFFKKNRPRAGKNIRWYEWQEYPGHGCPPNTVLISHAVYPT